MWCDSSVVRRWALHARRLRSQMPSRLSFGGTWTVWIGLTLSGMPTALAGAQSTDSARPAPLTGQAVVPITPAPRGSAARGGPNGVLPPLPEARARAALLEQHARAAWSAQQPGEARRLMVTAAAIHALGRPYIWGAGDASPGFDCSKLVQWSFSRAGLAVPRTSREQDRVGVRIPRDPERLAWGDLLFFHDADGTLSHVGIAIGDGQFIHASSHYGQVVLSELKGVYLARWIDARRLIAD